jgi:murein L,D-transpeptidase YcbB/YkuD
VRGVLEAQEPPHDRYQELKKALRQLLNKADSVNFNLLMTGLTYECIDLHKKVQCIEVNMERWRSEKNLMQRKYIWINIPAFQLQVVDNGRFVIESRIIVGKTESQTPVLSSTIEFITLFPYWRVPRKIAIQEYLPIIQNDTSFLKLNNFEVLDKKGNILDPATIKWQDFNPQYFPVSLRQQEGIENSLGIIKFVFDNPYAVFLHDTNVKSLFRKKTRAFSHGCIRMEKALDLAKYLAPNRTMVEEKISAKEQCTITLANPVAIYTRYFTCEYVNGRLNFYEDVYSLDKALIDLLYKKEIETICCDQTY